MKILLLLTIAAFSLTLPGCKKCSTCEWTAQGATHQVGEACGSSSVNTLETNCREMARGGGGTCNCKKS
jgi:hypothetical protein